MILFMYFLSEAQDVTLSGPGPCGVGAVSGTWTVPCDVTGVTIHVYGGGGGAGGGGGGSNGGFFNTRGGGGGGSGGYSSITISVTPNSAFSYSIGAGGCGGSNGSDGQDGGDGSSGGGSSFSGTDSGGNAVSLSVGGGARGTGGDGTNGSTGSGGGGGSAGGGTTNSPGNPGSQGSGGTGGGGGGIGGPFGGNGGAPNSGAGGQYGGGGAGGGDSPGGRGAAGGILITYTSTITIPVPTISSTPPTCTLDGASTISNYDPAMTYIFTPAGPTAGAGGVITGMITGTSYTVVARTAGGCDSSPSSSFSNAPATPLPVPTISTASPTCTSDGVSTITNHDPALTYIFTPTGPVAGAGGVVSGMVAGTSYTVESTDGICTSATSASFSNAAQFPAPVADITGSLSYCTGSNTTLTASGGTSFVWTDANANNIGNSASVTVIQGVYTVVVTDANTCADDTTVTVTEISGPTVTLTAAPMQICAGQSVTFTADPPGYALYEFYLSGTLNQSGAGNTYTSTTLAQGDNVTVRAQGNGCFGPISSGVSVTVLQIGTATVILSVVPDTICPGQSATVTATPSGYVEYEFSVNGTVVQSGPSNTYTTTTLAQGDNITARALDQLCFGQMSSAISVFIRSTIAVDAGSDIQFCLNDPAAILQGFSPAGGTWIGNGLTDPSGIFNPAIAGSGIHTLTYSVNDANGCQGADSIEAQVYAPSETDFSATPVLSEVNDSTPVVFTDFTSGAANWQWDFGDGTTSNIQNPTHVYSETGTYTVTLITTDANGCSDTLTRTSYIIIQGGTFVFVPTAFSPNNDGANDILLPLGKDLSKVTFQIFNRWGELVFESSSLNHGWDGMHKGEPAAMGVYVYSLKAEFTNQTTKKLSGTVTLVR